MKSDGGHMDLTKPVKKEGILSRKTGDEWVLYDTEKKSVHIVNSTAEFVWSLCDGTHTLKDIADRMRDTFNVPEGADLEKSVDEIIRNFSDLGIMETS
jgi:hypothetical protein